MYKVDGDIKASRPASSDDPLRGFLKFLNMAVHLVPFVAARLSRLPLSRAVEGTACEACGRPEVQHCCAEVTGSTIAALRISALFSKALTIACQTTSQMVASWGNTAFMSCTRRRRRFNSYRKQERPSRPAFLPEQKIAVHLVVAVSLGWTLSAQPLCSANKACRCIDSRLVICATVLAVVP